MSLEPIRLDDLTWSEMTGAARRRIPAASSGQWTLHAPVDPGITLLDLLAFLLEQRVYWMDHVPDSLVRGALALLGEKPLPTQVAATVMYLPKIDDFFVLPKSSQFKLDGSSPPVIFTAQDESVLFPFVKQGNRVGLKIDGKDRSADLAHGRALRLFPANGDAGEVKIVLYLRKPLPKKAAGKLFSLLVELLGPGTVAPQWSPKATSPPPATKVSWFYSIANGNRRPFAESEVKDGTLDLRRSGLITLPVKSDWDVVSDPNDPFFAYAIWMVVEKAAFSAPPRLNRLIPNIVTSKHERQSAKHELHREWLPLPGNEIAIADLPENDYPPIENTMKLEILERDGKWHDEWKQTMDLDFHGPSDRVFVVDRSLGKISFGNGVTGRLPVLLAGGKPQLKIEYMVGGGSAGKLGPSLSWTTSLESLDQGQADPDERFEAVNVVPTIGGEEPETIQAFRDRTAASLKTQTRAVLRKDFEEIARSVPGVAIKRAHAAVGFHPNHPCTPIPGAVTVFILPDVSRPDVLDEDFDETITESAFVAAPVPDEGALTAVRQALNIARLAGTEVFVLSPFYRNIKLTLVIESNSADSLRLSERIKLRLRRFFDPLIGSDDGSGWTFGEPVRPSAILRETQRVLGDQGTLVDVFIDLPDAKHTTYQIEHLSGGPERSCSFVQNSQDKLGSVTALGAREAEDFRSFHAGAVSDGPVVVAPACDDVEIGKHHLVKLLDIHLRFQKALESQGGLR